MGSGSSGVPGSSGIPAPSGASSYAPSTGAATPFLNQIRQLKPLETKAQFVYGWKRGEKYRYGFEARNEGSSESSGGKIGIVEYELTDLPRPSAASQDDSAKPSASGTAFVVHSDGLLMTCHHVVAGSTSLKVHLRGSVYPAQVVAIDKPNDLALIRIQATGLPALKLADSNLVRLAEDVKAVGYPLSDVLGKNVKITSGTISGKAEDPTAPRLQVDITINPGNSGGPLVNSRGEVVGVNSAGLFGGSIQEVSFAVPSNLGSDLLRSVGISGNGRGADRPLAGPDLADRVQPATAYVEVELGDEGVVLLQFTGSSKSTGNSIQPPQQITSRMVASVAGDVMGAQEDLPLGFGLGTFGTMVLEKLPTDGQNKWEERAVTPLSLGGKSRGTQQVISLLIEQRTEYELKSIDDDRIVIGKRINVSTVGSSALGSIKITGDGTWTFDRRAGVPQKLELNINSHVSIAGKTDDFRGTTRYELLRSDRPTTWQSNLEQQLATVDDSAPDDSGLPQLPELPPLALEPATDAEVSAALRILKNKRKTPREMAAALESLSRLKPTAKRQDDVAATLHNIRATFTRNMVPWLLAARVWGTEKNVPTVLFTLDSPTSDINERILCLEALGRLPTSKDSATAVVRYISGSKLRANALQAISGMGSAAEGPAADLLREGPQQRILGSALLARLGTKKSIPVMESYLRNETDVRCRAVGTAALTLLRERAKEAEAKQGPK
jgi:S1-C subfamily serine protease